MARSTKNRWEQPLPIGIFLFLIVFGVFSPCLWNHFTNFDDPTYVIWNPHVHSGLNWRTISWAFGSFYAANWHPLTWLSHAIDVQLYREHAWGHHLTSVLLHSMNTALLALVLIKATGSIWRSSIVALLFGIHPLHVESVAWIAERKDVLNGFFSLLTLLAYVRWAQDVAQRSKRWYLVALICFVLSLMAKPMSITLPILLLLWDYWPLQRLQSRNSIHAAVVEKIPFVLFAIVCTGATIAAQGLGGAIKVTIPLWLRNSNAVVSVVRYLWKLIWPHDLAAYYPYTIPSSVEVWLCIFLLLASSVAVFVWRHRLPWLFVGWWWFLISLVPVIGVIQIGTQAMADRYMYWPSIGLLVGLVWSVAYFAQKAVWARSAALAVNCSVVLAFSVLTVRQIGFWKDSETLFRHALAVTQDNPLAELNYGVALSDRAAYDAALVHLREAVRIAPQFPDAHLNLGMTLHEQGQLNEAIAEFEAAIRLTPDYSKAHANLAIAFQEKNDFERAMIEYREALRLEPVSPDVRVGFGLALQRSGQIDAALAQFEEAIKEDSSYAGAHSNRGIVLEKLGRLDEALTEYRKALLLDPKEPDASLNFPVVLFKVGQTEEAIARARELVKRRPDYAEAHYNLGGMLYSKADFDGAIAAYEKALELKPDYTDAKHNLDVTLEDRAAKAGNQK